VFWIVWDERLPRRGCCCCWRAATNKYLLELNSNYFRSKRANVPQSQCTAELKLRSKLSHPGRPAMVRCTLTSWIGPYQCHGFNNLERSYCSAVYWLRGTFVSGCAETDFKKRRAKLAHTWLGVTPLGCIK